MSGKSKFKSRADGFGKLASKIGSFDEKSQLCHSYTLCYVL